MSVTWTINVLCVSVCSMRWIHNFTYAYESDLFFFIMSLLQNYPIFSLVMLFVSKNNHSFMVLMT